ncbi:MAG: helix-turn-helix transcriptional regulator [Lachnospiraceae bacterium]|nr:helix-turn-helix transcriptional regulator [Lachnospiraceae bacterium]
MNEKLLHILSEKGITAYRLSKDTGIPYTTVREIVSQKTNINKCSAETVQKIAVYLNEQTENVLNPIFYFDGKEGKYRDIHYTWKKDNALQKMTIYLKDEDTTLDAEEKFINPRMVKYANLFAEMLIDRHLKEKELDQITENLIRTSR